MSAATVYVSGHCGVDSHDRCVGAYVGVDCGCSHHQLPPEPEMVTVRCFFGCPHVVREDGPLVARAEMEHHYFRAHREDIARAVGWVTA